MPEAVATESAVKGTPLSLLEGDYNFKALNDEIATKASLVSPTFAGTPTAPTAAPGTNNTQIATTEFVAAHTTATQIHSATAKTTPADADELGISDSAASWSLKKLTFANLKAWIGGLFVSKAGDTMTGNLLITTPGSTVARVQTQNALGAGISGMGWINAYEIGSATITPVHIYAGGVLRAVVEPTTGNVLATSGALGYGVGAGGTVVQATNKFTDVTLNKPCGRIIMNNAAMPAGAYAFFALLNSTISAADDVSVTMIAGINYRVEVVDIWTGGCYFRVTNTGTNSLSDALIFNFKVFKGALS